MAPTKRERFLEAIVEKTKFDILLEKFSNPQAMLKLQSSKKLCLVPRVSIPKLLLCPAGSHWEFWAMTPFFFFCFLGSHPRHVEVLKLGVETELRWPVYTTARTTRDLSHVCDLHHGSRQCRIL